MVSPWWSIVLTAVGMVGIVLSGGAHRPYVGWAVGVAAQLLWGAYAITTSQWGFLVSAVIVGALSGFNMVRTFRRVGTSTVGDLAAAKRRRAGEVPTENPRPTATDTATR